MTENLQHVQVPNKMADKNLTPRDQLIYSVIKSHDGEKGCFPSLKIIAEESGISINTVRKSIKNLEEAEYIIVQKVGRQQYYKFSPYKQFEPVSPDLLNNKEITPKTKAYIIASQQYMYKDVKDYGKISTSNRNLSTLINMPQSTINDCNTELRTKGFLQELQNKSLELDGSNCNTKTKIFHLTKLGQAIIWKLKDHEERINKNTEDINNINNKMSELEKTIKTQQELINKLLKSSKVEEYKL